MATFRDRIVEFRRVKAGELRTNPKNWRKHPREQKSAMTAILEEVGWAGASVARQTPDGLELIDGHLRAELDEEAEIPVLIVDVDDSEADKLLATFDPISAMANKDGESLRELLDGLTANVSEELAIVLREIGQNNGVKPPKFAPVPEEDQPRLDQITKAKCPECGHEFTPGLG